MTPAKISASGLAFLLVTAIGWGLNWPATKYVLAQWPPLSARGWSGSPARCRWRSMRWRWASRCACRAINGCGLVFSAVLNVSLWMAVMGYALVFLPAGEAAVIAYTMPVWTALLAWPLLGERMTLTRVIALVMAFAGWSPCSAAARCRATA